eukprot:scaffold323526_cov31-Tisochrysis_lutea.AAC.3
MLKTLGLLDPRYILHGDDANYRDAFFQVSASPMYHGMAYAIRVFKRRAPSPYAVQARTTTNETKC